MEQGVQDRLTAAVECPRLLGYVPYSFWIGFLSQNIIYVAIILRGFIQCHHIHSGRPQLKQDKTTFFAVCHIYVCAVYDIVTCCMEYVVDKVS